VLENADFHAADFTANATAEMLRSVPATLAVQVDKPVKEPAFRNPPQWIHESVAARFFAPLASRRDARRRAILALLDRLPGRSVQGRRTPK
jgi:hypothetical protein